MVLVLAVSAGGSGIENVFFVCSTGKTLCSLFFYFSLSILSCNTSSRPGSSHTRPSSAVCTVKASSLSSPRICASELKYHR